MRYGPSKKQITAPKEQSTSIALMQVSGVWSGSSVSWDILPMQAVKTSLTPNEIAALKRKHGSENLNMERIEQVKQMMQRGKTQIQIIHAMKGRKGCCERQIKKDMAALSKK